MGTARNIEVQGRRVELIEAGNGAPLLYLHGYADVHAIGPELLPFHEALAKRARLLAPAHPGVGQSAELTDGPVIGDVAFHYLELMDALGLATVDLVGHGPGGWIAAEIAVLIPERVRSLSLIGATGLFVSGAHIADIFMHAQADRGHDYSSLRHILFADPKSEVALRCVPDLRGPLDLELRRYQMLRFTSLVGFRPPYLYNHVLRRRLHRARMPGAVIAGEHDHLVPREIAQAYADGLAGAKGKLTLIPGAGQSAPIEQPEKTAAVVLAVVG